MKITIEVHRLWDLRNGTNSTSVVDRRVADSILLNYKEENKRIRKEIKALQRELRNNVELVKEAKLTLKKFELDTPENEIQKGIEVSNSFTFGRKE